MVTFCGFVMVAKRWDLALGQLAQNRCYTLYYFFCAWANN